MCEAYERFMHIFIRRGCCSLRKTNHRLEGWLLLIIATMSLESRVTKCSFLRKKPCFLIESQGKDMYLILENDTLSLVDPMDRTVLHSQPIASIRVWGVGRDNGR